MQNNYGRLATQGSLSEGIDASHTSENGAWASSKLHN